VSGLCAFTATNKLGMARASGIWSPLNIVVSLLWGAVLFDEFLNTGPMGLVVLIVSVAVIIVGVLLIIFAKGRGDMISNRHDLTIGLLGAIGAGILWGSYFIPSKTSDVSLWIATFPLTIGIFVGSTVLMLLGRQSPRLENRGDYVRVSASGVLWGIGNYAMLLLVSKIGAGRGFTIAQLAVVVNALLGVYWLKDPQPKTRGDIDAGRLCAGDDRRSGIRKFEVGDLKLTYETLRLILTKVSGTRLMSRPLGRLLHTVAQKKD
jgi:glucose uptake protein